MRTLKALNFFINQFQLFMLSIGFLTYYTVLIMTCVVGCGLLVLMLLILRATLLSKFGSEIIEVTWLHLNKLLLSMSKGRNQTIWEERNTKQPSGLLHCTTLLQRNPSGFGKGYRYKIFPTWFLYNGPAC